MAGRPPSRRRRAGVRPQPPRTPPCRLRERSRRALPSASFAGRPPCPAHPCRSADRSRRPPTAPSLRSRAAATGASGCSLACSAPAAATRASASATLCRHDRYVWLALGQGARSCRPPAYRPGPGRSALEHFDQRRRARPRRPTTDRHRCREAERSDDDQPPPPRDRPGRTAAAGRNRPGGESHERQRRRPWHRTSPRPGSARALYGAPPRRWASATI